MRSTRLLAAILCASCASSTGPGAAVRVQTSAPQFQVGAAVTFTVINAGDVTVLLASCGQRVMAAIDRWEGHWHQYSGEACLAIFSMAGRPLNPGAEYVGATGVRDPGRFRLRLGVSVAGEQVEWTGVSNAFEIQ